MQWYSISLPRTAQPHPWMHSWKLTLHVVRWLIAFSQRFSKIHSSFSHLKNKRQRSFKVSGDGSCILTSSVHFFGQTFEASCDDETHILQERTLQPEHYWGSITISLHTAQLKLLARSLRSSSSLRTIFFNLRCLSTFSSKRVGVQARLPAGYRVFNLVLRLYLSSSVIENSSISNSFSFSASVEGLSKISDCINQVIQK